MKTKKRIIPVLLVLGSLIVAAAVSPCLAQTNAQNLPESPQSTTQPPQPATQPTQSPTQPPESATQLTTMEQARLWVTSYYTNPRPSLLPSAMDVFSRAGVLKSIEGEGALIGFMSQVSAGATQDLLKSWVNVIGKKPEDQRVAFETALWIANTVESRLALTQMGLTENENQKKAVNNMLTRTPPNLLEGDIASPSIIDALWWSFYGGGDARFVERIISVLSMRTSQDTQEASIGRAAESSLISNASQQQKVMQICEASLWRASSADRALLGQVIQRAKAVKQ